MELGGLAMKDPKLVAFNTLRMWQKRVAQGSDLVKNPSFVFSTYTAVHTFFPLIREKVSPDNVSDLLMLYGPTYTHYLEMLDEMIASVETGNRPEVPTLIRFDLIKSSAASFYKTKQKALTSTGGSQIFDIESTTTSNSFGRGDMDLEKYFKPSVVYNLGQSKWIYRWTAVDGHLSDMVNFILATLCFDDKYGPVVHSGEDPRTLVGG